MAEHKKRADRGSQKERVFAHKARIRQLLDQGARHATIKAKLALEDIPQSTFQYLVKRIKDDAAPLIAAAPLAQELAPVPASGAGAAGKPASQNASDLTGASHGQEASSQTPQAEAAPKPAPRKRKFVQLGVKDAKDDSAGYDPSRWKKLDI